MKQLSKSSIPFDYITIKVTKSRIDKGLLAVPVSLIDNFAKNIRQIYLVDESGRESLHSFTTYTSSSKECRIGGLRHFYQRFKIKDRDELVVFFEGKDRIRLLPEKFFKKELETSLNKLHFANDASEFTHHLEKIRRFVSVDNSEILKNEFIKSVSLPIKKRLKLAKKTLVNAPVPFGMRKILASIYKGKCQLTDWSFLMKNDKPYFEVHHIDATLGNHFKNLLVVSPNIHAQFTYANFKQIFDNEGWLREVYFKNERYKVFQAIDVLRKDFFKELHL